MTLILSLEEPMGSAMVQDEGPWCGLVTSVEPLELAFKIAQPYPLQLRR